MFLVKSISSISHHISQVYEEETSQHSKDLFETLYWNSKKKLLQSFRRRVTGPSPPPCPVHIPSDPNGRLIAWNKIFIRIRNWQPCGRWHVFGSLKEKFHNEIVKIIKSPVCTCELFVFFGLFGFGCLSFFTNQGPSLLNDRGIDIKAMIYFRELANRFLSCPLRSWLVPSVKVVIISAGLFKEWISMVKGWCGLVVSSLTFGIYDMVVWLCEGSGILVLGFWDTI